MDVTLYYFGGAYEVRPDNTAVKYYSFAGQMIGMNGPSAGSGQAGMQYFLTDHLGSIVAVTDANGDLVSQQRYPSTGSGRRLALTHVIDRRDGLSLSQSPPFHYGDAHLHLHAGASVAGRGYRVGFFSGLMFK